MEPNKDEFPMLLYRCPGAHKAHEGHTYDLSQAKTPEDVDRLMKKGWCRSLPDAADAEDAKAAAKSTTPPVGAIPPKGK